MWVWRSGMCECEDVKVCVKECMCGCEVCGSE